MENLKTLQDVFDLIMSETTLNEGKLVKYTFDINTHYGWISMYQVIPTFDENGIETETKEIPKSIFTNIGLNTVPEIQLAYWSIFVNGRNRLIGI